MGEYEDWKAAESFWYFDAVRKSALDTARLMDALTALESVLPGGLAAAESVRATKSTDALERSVIKVLETMDRYRESLKEFSDLQASARKVVDSLDDPRHRAVLTMYYMNGRTWAEVAESIGYVEKYCMQLRDDAMVEAWEHLPKEWRTMLPRAD